MRIISFSKKWKKLYRKEFTTFRFPRLDKDWYVGEEVQVWYKTRSPERESICLAEIVSVESRGMFDISNEEAVADGFKDKYDMQAWLSKTHGTKKILANGLRINKLTLVRG